MSATLYTYFRSSAAYRVRIALHLKNLPYQSTPVHMLRAGGEQHQSPFSEKNPLHIIPVLEVDTATTLTQSLAIIEYLEEIEPQPPLLPESAADRARVRALALSIACEIHPLNNLRVLQYLEKQLQVSKEQREAWYRHWVELGLTAVEQLLATDPRTGDYCHGDSPGLADCCLLPQVYNAKRFSCSLEDKPTISAIAERCNALAAFQQAAPENQPDAE